jgi:hypothetical protein
MKFQAAFPNRLCAIQQFRTKIRALKRLAFFWVQNKPMIYCHARVSTNGQSVTAQVAELKKHEAGKVFREVASGAKAQRAVSPCARPARRRRRADGDAA